MQLKKNIHWKVAQVTCLTLFLSFSYGREKHSTRGQNVAGKAAATRPEKAFYNHTTNNNWMAVTNYGGYGDPNSPSTGRPSAQWPGGSGNNYLYDAYNECKS